MDVNELGLQVDAVLPWFVAQPHQHYVRVDVPPGYAAEWGELLRDAVRRCYATDGQIMARAHATQSTPEQILAAKLPDPGSVRSGEFGEILAYIYLASREGTNGAIGPKKWRLKQDRNKPAPYSDVVQFVVADWSAPSPEDRLVCAEVKAKSTDGVFSPITAALQGSELDQTSRLARTLVWLRDRARGEDIGVVTIARLNRFINATEYPQYTTEHYAIAVVCSGLVEAELAAHPPGNIPHNCAVVVMSVPNLQHTYMTVYCSVQNSVVDWAPPLGV